VTGKRGWAGAPGPSLLSVLRYWKAFTDLLPPEELRRLLERLFCGEGLYLYAR
jgi:hypothetical protein